ncbi:PP2C family protein-serine/threonine phosphatase [Tautonia rosea]|uniref:PP2C family protein-serine/threonine phosphatase n=1 Tax=Tautonia rosea TaxID=2728037 RepID=UPI0014746D68|nr:protein phosphatase 2C domain-containing protein [Tautonia rosea]
MGSSRGLDPSGTPRRLRLRIGVVTTTGNVREHNEDNFYVPGYGTLASWPKGLDSSVEIVLQPADSESSITLDNGNARTGQHGMTRSDLAGPFIVADGMGGQLAGEQASRIAVELIPKELFSRCDGQSDQEAIRQAIAAANREIIAQAHVVPECSNMGTTVVLAVFRPGRALVTGIGDSRAYRLRGKALDRLTRDHDLASALISAGTIRPEEARNHQFRHVLYLYLGSPEARDGPEDIRVDDLLPGDRFLLASDGLTGVVTDETLADMLGRQDDPHAIAQQMVRTALHNESRDNVTCMVITVEALIDETQQQPTAEHAG